MKYANKKGFRLALIAGGDEFAAGVWQVKNLKTGAQASIATVDLVAHLTTELSVPTELSRSID